MAQKLKVDFHIHTSEDPTEHIPYNAFQLIHKASQEAFDAIAITNHNVVTYNKDLVSFAEKKGILLLPGMEATFSNKHVLIINPDFKKNPLNRPLKDLSKIKNNTNLIIAPHPFFPTSKSLKSTLFQYLSFFDAIEFSHYYNHVINCNKKAVEIANLYNKPLVGTSDCHNLMQLGTTYALVEAEKEPLSIIEAVKKGKIELCTTPFSLISMSRVAVNFYLSKRFKALNKLKLVP